MYNWCGKKLLILGATKLIAEIVKEAKKYGAFVYVADYNENSPAKLIADKSLLVDATNVDEIVNIIKKEHISGVLTGYCDSLLPAYEEICRKTNLPCYIDKNQIKFTMDKSFFKECCQKFDISTVKEYQPKDPISFPVIVKPVDNSGAIGISICNNEEELDTGIKNALANSKQKKILIEKYLNCREATIFYVFNNGQYYFALMGDRHIAPVKDGFIKLPTGYTFPSPYSKKTLDSLHKKFIKMFGYLGIKNGTMFIQSFIDNNGNCIPYEPGFRLTASFENDVLEKICGYNPMDMMINFALTGTMTNEHNFENKIDIMLHNQKAYNISCLIRPGKIGKISGLKELEKIPNIIKIFLSYDAGDELPETAWGKLAQIGVRILFIANNSNEYNMTINFISKVLKVENINREDMLINKDIIKEIN